jgi:hypothetical protein
VAGGAVVAGGRAGQKMRKVVPLPGVLSTAMMPW